jgi:hypothetical protein
MSMFISILVSLLIHTLFYQITSSSYQIRTIVQTNWDIESQSYINKGCKYNTTGQCTGYCPLTLKRCVELANFNTKVCGCAFCSFNITTRKCNGQCGNLVLDRCVSKVEIPKKDSDCFCRSCTSEIQNLNFGDADYPDYQDFPTCDSSTCSGNSCEPLYVSVERKRVNETIYCNCQNSFTG